MQTGQLQSKIIFPANQGETQCIYLLSLSIFIYVVPIWIEINVKIFLDNKGTITLQKIFKDFLHHKSFIKKFKIYFSATQYPFRIIYN